MHDYKRLAGAQMSFQSFTLSMLLGPKLTRQYLDAETITHSLVSQRYHSQTCGHQQRTMDVNTVLLSGYSVINQSPD